MSTFHVEELSVTFFDFCCTHTYIHMCVYVHMYQCVCVCMWAHAGQQCEISLIGGCKKKKMKTTLLSHHLGYLLRLNAQ